VKPHVTLGWCTDIVLLNSVESENSDVQGALIVGAGASKAVGDFEFLLEARYMMPIGHPSDASGNLGPSVEALGHLAVVLGITMRLADLY